MKIFEEKGNRIVLAALALFVAGCVNTVVPKGVDSATAAFVGDVIPGRGDATGEVLTPDGRDHYNALVDRYGKDPEFAPALKKDAGIVALPDGNFHITKDALTNFITMHKWLKSGRLPR